MNQDNRFYSLSDRGDGKGERKARLDRPTRIVATGPSTHERQRLVEIRELADILYPQPSRRKYVDLPIGP